ncbi:hypothetical protein BTO06_12925 [Tenacibaculum sp. SZ-18]|uniref:hypothetical protein n=1 Tax=Tenacibaculum sp. SZ-18 TaxID=754423 RepID=UPI000C2D0A30|nr:hypothetical protein [Tenacibaculum sp. SZ-18]AUC16002.1 hypothetical protein BTO06_12925 [Tenacibaculum sp. SZ-18]
MRIENYKIADWEVLETGVFLDENEGWILIKSIPSDYQLDGFKLLNKNHIVEISKVENSSVIQKVIELKEIKVQNPNDFKFDNTIEILKRLEAKYGCFEFQDEVEEELFYGTLGEYDDKSFSIDFIKSDGTIDLDFDEVFEMKDIRTISFESNYFNSISLLYNHCKKNRK